MIGFILWSVLLIQLTTGSPVVSRSISCRRCKGAEISQNVLKEGLAVTSDEMVYNIIRVFPDYLEENQPSDYIKIHRLKKFQLEMMQKEGKANFMKYFASLIDEMVKSSCKIYPRACESGKQTSRTITELKISEKADYINNKFKKAPFSAIGCDQTDKNKWKECKIKKYNLLTEIIDIKESCSYSDEECSKYHYD